MWFWQHWLYPFFNSNFFIATVTLAGGAIVYVIYRRTIASRKRDSANVVYNEMKNAERVLKEVRKQITTNDRLLERVYLMKSESWSKYKYLFVNNLDRDEWDAITEFYTKSILYDEAVAYNDSAFQKNEEQVRTNLQRVISEFSKDYIIELEKTANDQAKREIASQKLEERTSGYYSSYLSEKNLNDYWYVPKKPVIDAKIYLDNLTANPSLISAQAKLKKLAKLAY